MLWVVEYLDDNGKICFMDHTGGDNWEEELHNVDLIGLEILSFTKFGGEWE